MRNPGLAQRCGVSDRALKIPNIVQNHFNILAVEKCKKNLILLASTTNEHDLISNGIRKHAAKYASSDQAKTRAPVLVPL